MTKSPQTDRVGDTKAPPLKPDPAGLKEAADFAPGVPADTPPKFTLSGPLATAARVKSPHDGLPPGSCKQIVWISFFFDGTGNNLEADVGTAKHSNVAKLYRAHLPDNQEQGIYRVYIPGVGTNFDKVGDDGGGMLGLGSGIKGDARLNWAFTEFDERLAYHIALNRSPANKLLEVNVSVFGFSRGAALARAFVNRFLKRRCVQIAQNRWQLTSVKCPLRIRFMGLFDTVASVGLPMSKNNMSIEGAAVSAAAGPGVLIGERLNSPYYAASRPSFLAFAKRGAPGADPAPGIFDGHPDWGGELAIPEMVEEVRHFVAAHELRNSFPVDSVTVLQRGRAVRPPQFYEYAYPGVHSDVGGSYRPGEDGKGLLAPEKLGLITLHQMYDYAIERNVPLRGKLDWRTESKEDFAISPKLIELYRYYWSKIPHSGDLGREINSHMRLYYAWRFRAIRLKLQGDHHNAQRIKHSNVQFKVERMELEKRIAVLEQANDKATQDLNSAIQLRLSYAIGGYAGTGSPQVAKQDARIAAAKRHQAETQAALLKEKAKLDALPDMDDLPARIAMYDAQLIRDARAIRARYANRNMLTGTSSEQRTELRPHYKALMDAYEDEFIHDKGLTDERIIAFFDGYVHDSLAGFAKDATLPSDPRVVYLGGDEKYRYALHQHKDDAENRAYAATDMQQAQDAVG